MHPFIRRDAPADPPDIAATRSRAYHRWLASNADRLPPDLLAYFGDDFFHDGDVTAFDCRHFPRAVTLAITAPNIEMRTDSGWSFIRQPLALRVVFSRVRAMNIEPYAAPDHADEPAAYDVFDYDCARGLEFRYGEIGDITSLHDAPDDPDNATQLYSLRLILGSFLLTLSFEGVSVESDEPAAWTLMQQDPRYHLPTYGAKRPD